MKSRIKVLLIISYLTSLLISCNNSDTHDMHDTNKVEHSDNFTELKVNQDNDTTVKEEADKSEEYNERIVSELNKAIEQNELNKDNMTDKHTEITEDKEKYFSYHSTEVYNNFDFNNKPEDMLEIGTVDEKLADTLYNHLEAFCEINSLDISTLTLSDNKDFPVQFTGYYSYIFNISGIDVYAVCNPSEGCYITIL